MDERTSTAEPRLPRLGRLDSFARSMGQGWADADRTPSLEPGAVAAAAAHRELLSALHAGRTIVVGSGTASVRSNDTYHDFRADSDFLWLTGAPVEDAVLVLVPAGSGHDAVLHLPAPARPGDPAFFTDAAHGELWVGPAPGTAEWGAALGIEVRDLGRLDATLGPFGDPLVAGRPGRALPDRYGQEPSADLARTLADLRMVKDDWEIARLREAVDRTVEGFAQVTAEIPTAVRSGGERWLQGTFDRYARTVGNGPGYATIVASGSHAPTLHWVRCDGPVLQDELLLLDMGVETRSHYTADVTRTFPASGRFTPVQRQVHDLVERSHRAGLAAVGPGRPFTDFHHASMEVIARGLRDWGLLPVSVDEALSDTGQQHRRYLVCGIGHHLGLDVHDCASATYEAYHGREMAAGMVLTVEPGLYFHAHDLTVPPELRGIGVRIEDDVLVTTDGADVLSDALPLDAGGLEDWMRATH